MRLDELIGRSKTQPRPNLGFGDFMRGNGFRRIGLGAYGSVWQHPRLDYILKMFLPQDAAYVTFLRYCLTNRGNPCLPVFRGGCYRITDDVMACRIETLDKLSREQENQLDRLKPELLAGLLGSRTGEQISKKYPLLSERFIQTLRELDRVRESHGFTWDIHTGNMMQRGQEIVIIDPFELAQADYMKLLNSNPPV